MAEGEHIGATKRLGSPPLTPDVDRMRTEGNKRGVDSIRHHGTRVIPTGNAGGGLDGDHRDKRFRREDKYVASHSISDDDTDFVYDEIHTLSTQKPRTSRSEIGENVPSSSVNADKMAKRTTSSVTPRPPWTSDSRREMDLNDADCVTFNFRYNSAMTADSDGPNGNHPGLINIYPGPQVHRTGLMGASPEASLAPSGQAGAADRPAGSITSHRPNIAASAGNSATN